MSLVNGLDYSIIICTYNPDERLLKRCLSAITQLDISGLRAEVILVDNNSTEPLSGLSYIKDFLTKKKETKFIEVKEQGLSYARMGGIAA